MRLCNAGCYRSYVLMRGYAAFMLSVLRWNTIKYRCGDERQAVMLLSKTVHPVSYLSGRADCARTPTHIPAEKDRVEKTTTTTQHANNQDCRQRISSSVGFLECPTSGERFKSLVHKTRLSGRRGKGTVESFSRRRLIKVSTEG